MSKNNIDNFTPQLKVINVNDADLKIRVIAALLANPQTDRAFIRVKCEQGIVTLDGQVDTLSAKAAAKLVAGRQRDVRGIVDKIKVTASDDETITIYPPSTMEVYL